MAFHQNCIKSVKDIEETKIVEMIRLGRDREVMPVLYKKVLPQVKNYIARNNGKRDDAYDVFHDAVMLFYDQVVKGSYDSKYNVFGYLYRISVFRWINKIKRDQTVLFQEEIPETALEPSWISYDAKRESMEPNQLLSLFERIGEKCIELLRYTIFTEMYMEDIMHRMNFASVDAVRMQQMRCKQKLIKEVEKNPDLLKKLKVK